MSVLTKTGTIAGTATLALGTFVAGLHIAGGSSDASPASAHTSSTVTCAALPQLSDKARAAIKAARAETDDKQRAAALKKVHADIAKGTYGDDSKSAQARRAKLHADVSDSYKKAREAVRKLPESQRKAARQTLRKDLLAGKYGDAAKQSAEDLQKAHATCAQERQKTRTDKRVAKCTARAEKKAEERAQGKTQGKTQKSSPAPQAKQDASSGAKSS